MSRGGIDASALRGVLGRGQGVVAVREAEEHARGSVPGAVSFDAYDALNAGEERAMEGLRVPGGARVVTGCNRGRSAALPAERPRNRGHDAAHLEGGMEARRDH